MTNQTKIFTDIALDAISISDDVNDFIKSGIASGYINFDIKPVVTETKYDAGSPEKNIYFVVQVNYYDPSIM